MWGFNEPCPFFCSGTCVRSPGILMGVFARHTAWSHLCYPNMEILKPRNTNAQYTMKIALFSDIHANLPALEAFFADVEKQHPDAMYCLGDLVGYNIWPNEVIDEIRKRGIPTIT